jgi:hypothetical protein
MRVLRPVPDRLPSGHPTAAVDQLLLRSVLVVATAMGVAMIAVGSATYLLAVDRDGAAWALFGVAAVFTVAMVAVPLWHARRLRALVGPAD